MRRFAFCAVALGLNLILISSVCLALTPAQDFKRRFSSPGVVRAIGFDSLPAIKRYLEPAWDGVYRGTLDKSIKASGIGSLRFTIPPYSQANCAGDFNLNFADNFSKQFGEGQEFYVQWRQRFSPEMLDTNFGGDGFKQIIIGEGDRAGYWAPGCSELEIVLYNPYFRGLPEAYHSCDRFIPWETQCGADDWKLQNAIPAPYCLYSNNPSYELQGNPPCFIYKANQWMTFQVHVKIGHWNEPDSLVEMWGAYEGQPSELFLQMNNVTLYQSDPSNAPKYGKVLLTPYMTNKDDSLNHPKAYTWYDELIVSTKKIPDPVTVPAK